MVKPGPLKPYEIIVNAASSRGFVTYEDIAIASGQDSGRARFVISRHLGKLAVHGLALGWPMLISANVVQKRHTDGKKDRDFLDGLLRLAGEGNLKFDWNHPGPFVRGQQEQLFAWAKIAPDKPDLSGMPM